jgi:hypothetical protein
VLVSYFLLFLYFRKVIQEIFSELDETKAKPPIFPDMKTKSKVETEEGTEVGPHHLVARVLPWPRQAMVWAPRPSSDIALPPINSLQRENPKRVGLHPQKVPQRRGHRRQVLGDRNLYSGTLPGRGIAP